MIVVAIIGILAAIAIPAFLRNAKKAKTAEATVQVKKIYDGARAYYAEESNAKGSFAPIAKQFPGDDTGAANLTNPALGACCGAGGKGGKCDPTDATEVAGWKDSKWNALKFSMSDPHYYMYHYEAAGLGTAAAFTVDAYGDLNCDAVYSTFEMQGKINAEGEVVGQAGMYRDKELE